MEPQVPHATVNTDINIVWSYPDTDYWTEHRRASFFKDMDDYFNSPAVKEDIRATMPGVLEKHLAAAMAGRITMEVYRLLGPHCEGMTEADARRIVEAVRDATRGPEA